MNEWETCIDEWAERLRVSRKETADAQATIAKLQGRTERQAQENYDQANEVERLQQRVTQLEWECWKEHVPVAGTQHDPANGLIHGYCIRCRREWPCEWSPEGKLPTYTAFQADHARVLGLVQALPVVCGVYSAGRQVFSVAGVVWTFRTNEEAESYAALLTYRAS